MNELLLQGRLEHFETLLSQIGFQLRYAHGIRKAELLKDRAELIQLRTVTRDHLDALRADR
jgi:hypothetical protein